MASLSALHVTAEPAAHAEKHIMQYWKMNLVLWPLFSVALRTRSPTGWTECVDILKCVSLSLLLSLMPFLSPSWRFFFDFRLPVILSCLFFFFFAFLLLLLLLLRRLSPGSAGGLSEQPRHRPVWGEQRGGERSLPQHQEGSLS